MKEDKEKKIISLQLPIEMLNKIEDVANETCSNTSQIIRIAIRQYLEKRDSYKGF